MDRQRSPEVEKASDWICAFGGVALVGGLVAYSLAIPFKAGAFIATAIAIPVGLALGVFAAQIPSVRKLIAWLVWAVISWTR